MLQICNNEAPLIVTSSLPTGMTLNDALTKLMDMRSLAWQLVGTSCYS